MKNINEAMPDTLKCEEQEQRAKIKALKLAIDEGDASGVGVIGGDPFGRVLERLRREEQTSLK